jgi:hypothetical protein
MTWREYHELTKHSVESLRRTQHYTIALISIHGQGKAGKAKVAYASRDHDTFMTLINYSILGD